MPTVLALTLLGTGTVFLVVVLLLPRLLFRPVLRYRIMALRDEVYDARLAGTLPYDHAAPAAFIDRAESLAASLDYLTPIRLLIGAIAFRRVPQSERERLRAEIAPNLDGLDPSAQEHMRGLLARLNFSALTAPLLGTWLGVFCLLTVALALGVLAFVASAVSNKAQARTRQASTEALEVISFERAGYSTTVHGGWRALSRI